MQSAQEKGKPLGRWSLSENSAHLVTLGLVTSIAGSTIGRWFTEEKLSLALPHLAAHSGPRDIPGAGMARFGGVPIGQEVASTRHLGGLSG